MTVETYRPEYIVALTQNALGRMTEPKEIVLQASEDDAGEILERCQADQDHVNWLIDLDGTVYELEGWDRAVPEHPDGYVVRLVREPGDYSDPQRRALDWLIGQIRRKRQVSEVVDSTHETTEHQPTDS